MSRTCDWVMSALLIFSFQFRSAFLPCQYVGSPASQTLITAWIAPKIFQGQPPTMYSECSRFNPNWFTFSGVIAKRVNTAKMLCEVNPIFGRSLASSWIIKWILWRHQQTGQIHSWSRTLQVSHSVETHTGLTAEPQGQAAVGRFSVL